NESLWTYYPDPTAVESMNHYRIVSSDAPIIVHVGSIGGHSSDNGIFAPNRENGNLVSAPRKFPAPYYMTARPGASGAAGDAKAAAETAIVGNVGAATASYKIWKYVPSNPDLVPPPGVDINLTGNAGTWYFQDINTVAPGLASPANAHI